MAFLDKEGLLYLWQKITSLFVKKDGNKVLSDKNFTSAYEEKLKSLNNYTLPAATSSTIGGVKPGTGLEVEPDGTLNATGGGEADSVDWENVKNKPTNVSQFTNDSGYQTSGDVQQAINKAKEGLATEEYVNNKVSTVYRYKGTVANKEALPASAEIGDTYNLQDTGMNVAWNGTAWDDLGADVDLSGYYSKEELKPIENSEIDKIVAS